MNFPSINIQGNIVSGEILDKLVSEDIKYQTSVDFGLIKGTKVRDEVGLAWASARGYWQAFKLRKERIPEDESGTSETRNFWMLPFLSTLGYELDKSNAANIDGKTYAISHRSSNLEGFPVHIMGIHDSLDKRRETSGPRLSPHGLLQEYLNKTDDYLYALVTNGKQLRLLRDATRLVRLTYLEFDLEKMMEEELFADFAILYRILHASRMPKERNGGEESYIEYYHQESLASGTRIREKLSEAVESSIKRLGNGFLKHPENTELREMVQNGELSGKQYYLFLLRLIYRFLFLLVTEDRGLVYPEKQDEVLTKLRKIYYDYYSMGRVRNLALRRIFIEGAKHDLWENLKITFQLFESGKYGEKLGIKPLGSGIFHSGALGVLSHSKLKNEDLLYVIYRLCYFQDEQRKQLVKVNYGDLDVEEFGSVYQGLLEFDPVFSELETSPNFGFVQGTDRSSSGSHYTPEELVRPLIQHSLEYIIQDCIQKPEERLKLNTTNLPKNQLQEKALLAIKVCDISCGSGHILLSAARRIGMELAKVRTGEDQPSPSVMRHAIRDVIRECIYGVDKNPLAVELCKVALWLEAHSPGEPLNFLDHKIKCGDAIVGLAYKEELEKGIAEEAFKALPGDDKAVATRFRNRNREELKQKNQITLEYAENVNESVTKAIEQFQLFKNLPERTPEEIEAKRKRFAELNTGANYSRLKSLADMQVAQFFIPKTSENKGYICTDGTYRKYLREKTVPTGMPPAKAAVLAQEKGFFHYFLEFPEVFQGGGFDCVLGNPPFLGDRKLKEAFGEEFLEWIRYNFTEGATVDLVVYFFLRINSIIKTKGFQSLISTNTVAQGKAREFGLDRIVTNGSVLNHAVKGMKWPGLAAVEVSLITLFKDTWRGKFYLNGRETNQISTFLDEADNTGTPFQLFFNEGKSYQGSIVLCSGFVLEINEATKLKELNPKYKEVISLYLNGDDLNTNPYQEPSRFVINFFDMSEKKAREYSDVFNIIEEKVKPERWKKKSDESYPYWFHWRPRKDLYEKLKHLKFYFLTALTGKNLAFTKADQDLVISHAAGVILFERFLYFSFIQSSYHELWAWKYCSSMGISLRYTPSDGFQTFPFPKNFTQEQEQLLETIGEAYHENRKHLMLSIQLGLTKTYNLFHSKAISTQSVQEQDKQVAALQKHLEKTEGTISNDKAIQGILKLRDLHLQMDEAVLDAYGWTDIQLRHDFYEVEYLPENDRIRYNIHPDARKEILKRLLELNHQYFEEEAKQGLHKQKDVEAFYEQKGKPVPEEVAKWYVKGKGPKETKPKPPKLSPQPSLFEATTPLFSQPSTQKIGVGSKVTIRSTDAKEMKYIIQESGEKGTFTPDGYKLILADSALAEVMLGKMEDDKFEFGGMGYRVIKIISS
jgi:hypothetical protein